MKFHHVYISLERGQLPKRKLAKKYAMKIDAHDPHGNNPSKSLPPLTKLSLTYFITHKKLLPHKWATVYIHFKWENLVLFSSFYSVS